MKATSEGARKKVHTFSLVSIYMHAQYMAWAGLSAADEDQFWTDSTVRQLIKNQLSALAYRHNVFNGNLYRNEPAIFAWDIYNVCMLAIVTPKCCHTLTYCFHGSPSNSCCRGCRSRGALHYKMALGALTA